MSHGHMTESLQTTNGQNLHDSYTCMQYIVVQNVHKCTQTPIANAVTMICIPMRKDYTFRRQFNEKPSIIPGCPGCIPMTPLYMGHSTSCVCIHDKLQTMLMITATRTPAGGGIDISILLVACSCSGPLINRECSSLFASNCCRTCKDHCNTHRQPRRKMLLRIGKPE